MPYMSDVVFKSTSLLHYIIQIRLPGYEGTYYLALMVVLRYSADRSDLRFFPPLLQFSSSQSSNSTRYGEG